MALKLPIGTSDFKEAIENGYYFVDKSLFIRDIIENPAKIILITRPRRFGKTINLSMAHHFLNSLSEKNELNLFKGLAISNNKEFCETYQNKRPVIFVTFKDIKDADFESTYNAVYTLISDLYRSFRPILQDSLSEDEIDMFNSIIKRTADKSFLKNSLLYLCQFLHKKTGLKPYVLIDEYDTPLSTSYVNGYYNEMIEMMRGLLGVVLKDNSFLEKGIVTGIARIAQESIFSGVNNLEVHTLLGDQYGQYFGFTEEEVISLLEKDNNVEHLEELKTWYNGYQVGEYTLYNPWSILSCIKNKYKYQPYWLGTSDNTLIKSLITRAPISTKTCFEDLLQGVPIERPIDEYIIYTELDTNINTIWSLLLFTGYLKINSPVIGDDGATYGYVTIPNKEVSTLYVRMIRDWFATKTLDVTIYRHFLRAFIGSDISSIKRYIQKYISESGSYFDFNKNTPEQVFHVFMLGIVAGLRDHYIIKSNRESGFGRYDMAMIPKDNVHQGFILEFKIADAINKLADKSKEALEQIRNNNYISEFSLHKINSVVLMGFAFFGENMELAVDTIEL